MLIGTMFKLKYFQEFQTATKILYKLSSQVYGADYKRSAELNKLGDRRVLTSTFSKSFTCPAEPHSRGFVTALDKERYVRGENDLLRRSI
jgi:hypothetical protein